MPICHVLFTVVKVVSLTAATAVGAALLLAPLGLALGSD